MCVLERLAEAIESQTQWLKSHYECATKQDLREMEKRIMAKEAEVIQQVKDLTVKINKIGTETATTLAKVTELQAIIDAGNGGVVSEELQAAITEAIAAAQATDDLTPDAPVEPPV